MKRSVRITISALLAAVITASCTLGAGASGCQVKAFGNSSESCQSLYNSDCRYTLSKLLKQFGCGDGGCSQLTELLNRSRYCNGNNNCSGNNRTDSLCLNDNRNKNNCGNDSSCEFSGGCSPTENTAEKPTQSDDAKDDHAADSADNSAQQPQQPPTEATTQSAAHAPAQLETQPAAQTETQPTANNQNNASHGYQLNQYEKEVVSLINDIRRENGLGELSVDTELSRVARIKSQDMRDKGYFSHTSPTYGSPFEMMTDFGIRYRTAGENIAMGYRSPKAVVDGWMNSPGHRANILNGRFTKIGMGFVEEGNYWTQMFIG